jgi:hypothetical protein
MEPIGCPETSVRKYHYSLRNNSEERSSRENFVFSQLLEQKMTLRWQMYSCKQPDRPQRYITLGDCTKLVQSR